MTKRTKIVTLLVIISLLFMSATVIKKQNMSDIYTFKILESGSIQPKGWIFKQLNRDLTQGYVGRYDEVHASVNKNVFVNQNRISKRRLGLRKEWWSGEHEGYWKDGVIRMAFLTQNKAYMEKANRWIDEIKSGVGRDGYIGIYKDCEKPGCRFHHIRGNGELWATSRIVMGMLAYYEYTGDETVLDAAEKAVKLVMEKYSHKNYFATESNGGGISHGIGFFENLEWLYRITGDYKYIEFAAKLYNDFNAGNFRDDDLKTNNLLVEERLFKQHGAHIAEGLFVPRFIASIEEHNSYAIAADNVIAKLDKHLTPGGAMRCDEWIKGREGTADERYEYCGIAEMIGPLNRMIAFTGNLALADRIETMVFNAGQGARFPVLTALSYLTSDNRIKINHREIVKRESYDAAHLAAICCALNGSRLMPYFVEGMWMKDVNSNALLVALFGPCELHTSIDNVPVTISEETAYPFSDQVTFTIHTNENIRFPLMIRKPFGGSIQIKQIPESATVQEEEKLLIITNSWGNNSVVQISFDFDIEKISQPGSKTVEEEGVYFKRGPLVYSLPFEYKTDTVKEYKNSGFYRYKIRSVDPPAWNYKLNRKDVFTFEQSETDKTENMWENPPLYLSGTLRNRNNEKENVKLVPMGATVLRRVTFALANKQ